MNEIQGDSQFQKQLCQTKTASLFTKATVTYFQQEDKDSYTFY